MPSNDTWLQLVTGTGKLTPLSIIVNSSLAVSSIANVFQSHRQQLNVLLRRYPALGQAIISSMFPPAMYDAQGIRLTLVSTVIDKTDLITTNTINSLATTYIKSPEEQTYLASLRAALATISDYGQADIQPDATCNAAWTLLSAAPPFLEMVLRQLDSAVSTSLASSAYSLSQPPTLTRAQPSLAISELTTFLDKMAQFSASASYRLPLYSTIVCWVVLSLRSASYRTEATFLDGQLNSLVNTSPTGQLEATMTTFPSSHRLDVAVVAAARCGGVDGAAG